PSLLVRFSSYQHQRSLMGVTRQPFRLLAEDRAAPECGALPPLSVDLRASVNGQAELGEWLPISCHLAFDIGSQVTHEAAGCEARHYWLLLMVLRMLDISSI